jgi:member of the syntaxin family of t-SNAREs
MSRKWGGGGKLPDPNTFSVSGGRDGEEDPYGEFEHQQQMEMMQEQDEQLDGVFRTVGNLRMQAQDMGRELEDQAGMLEEVDTLADRVGGKLQNGVKKVGYIIKKNEGELETLRKGGLGLLITVVADTVSSCCIAVLIFVLILLLILVIVL